MIVELIEQWFKSEQALLEEMGENRHFVYALVQALIGLAGLFLFLTILKGS